MRIELTRAEGTNFLQYPRVEMPLGNQGLVFLAGELEHNRQRSNSAGKTAALSLVSWVIWGKILKDTRDVGRVVRYDADSCTGVLEGTIEGQPFTIERTRTRKDTIVRASFAGSSRAQDVQAEINAVFGTFELAQNTVFLAQRKALEFLTATDADRRRILEELLKIGVWREALDRVKSDIEWARENRVTLQRELSDAQVGLDKIRTEIRHARELALTDIRTRIGILEATLAERKQGIHALQFAALDAKNMVDNLRQDYEAARRKLTSEQDDFNAYLRKAASMRSAIDAKRQVMRMLASGMCPTCNRPTDDKTAHDRLADEITAAESELEALHTEYIAKDKVINRLSGDAERAHGTYRAAMTEKRVAEEKLHDANNEILRLSKDLADLDRKLGEADVALSQDHTEAVERFERIVASRTEALADLDRGVKAMEFWKEGFSFKGIPSMLITESLPLLVQKTNEVLAVLSDDEMSIDILPADAKRDGKSLLEKLTFVVSKDGRDVYMEDCSAGEQRRIVISIFLALAKMQSVLTGQSWNIRLVDELFDELDPHGIERVMRVLRGMADGSTILVTSHRSELASLDGFARCWTVRRGLNGSVLHTT